MISPQLEEGFDNPQVQVEYDIFSICSDIKRLTDDFDNGKCLEAFFNKSAVEDINLAVARLTSIAAVISYKG